MSGEALIELQQPLSNESCATAALDTRGSAPLPTLGASTAIPGHQLLTADAVALMLRVWRSSVGMGAWRTSLRLLLAGDACTKFAHETGVSGFEGMRIKYKATPGDPGREVATITRAWVDDGDGETERADSVGEAQTETPWEPLSALSEGRDQPPSRGRSER
ncbi:MAG TPA: hypothetical protein VGL78_15495 [Solirubrobacteraceae bacterium]|jgi:hypothetical protein